MSLANHVGRVLASPRAAVLVREVRRQTSARRTLVRPPGEGTVVTRVRRVPVVARLDPRLVLARQQRRVRQALVDVLAEVAATWWPMPTPSGVPLLGVRVEDRDRLLSALRDRLGPAFYADPLAPTGRREHRAIRVQSGLPAAVAGLLLWEYAVPRAGSSFVADERQGTTVIFFAQATARAEGATTRFDALADNLACSSVADPDELVVGEVPAPLRAPQAAAPRFPVDVVYTWVDGMDDAWLLDKARAAGAADPALFTERAHDEARFADHDELRHSLRSLEQFAPWVRHVFVVTSGQHPSWLVRDHPWVSVVPHRDLWPDAEGLPTFNSHAIETCLHRIPGLSEHFLYLNDDMLLGQPVGPETFFHANGIGKFFWSRALVDHGPAVTGDIASTTAARNARSLIEERYGLTFTRKFFHTAAALTVSGLAELEATFPEVVTATRRAPFRTLHDVAMAGSFYLNWAYVTGRSVPGRLRYTYVDPAAPDAAHRLRLLVRRRSFEAFCVNDGSSEQTPEQRRESDRLIRGFLADYLPVPGSFETS